LHCNNSISEGIYFDRMELYQLKTFAAVAESGHLTRAAERLHISQPAVSAQIKALEEVLDVRLFERSAAGMTLTRAGARLLEEARKVLAAAEEMKSAAKALKGEVSGRLRIGTVSDPEFIRLGGFSGRAMHRFPLLELEFHNEFSGAAVEAVREGALDAAFYVGQAVPPHLDGLALREMPFRVVGPAAWADRVRVADWDAMAALPWVLMPKTSTHHELAQVLFRDHGMQPSRLIEADQESVIANLVVSGLGLSLLPENLALDLQKAGDLCVSEDALLRATLWFIFREERANDPLISGVVDVLRETWSLGEDGADDAGEPVAGERRAGSRQRASIG
jgi:DNA-binding transcriptional LysR family regulator